MKTFSLQLCTLLNAMLLALPPGWCMSVCQPQIAEPAAAKMSCCQRAAAKTTDSTKSPVMPTVRCCCLRDATVPEKSVQLPDVHSLFLPTVSNDLASLGEYPATYEAAFIPIDAGLRLHVLLCVWRC